MFVPSILILLCALQQCLGFTFKQLTVSPSLSNVGVTTQYYFYMQRSVSSSNGQSAWNTILVPAGSTITVTFPSEYTITSSVNCISVLVSTVAVPTANCSTSGNVVTVSGAIPADAYIDVVELSLGNVVNPVPAVNTGSFQGTIGIDVSLPDAGVQLTPSSFDSCTVTFDTAYVNQTTSTMVITLDPKNALDSTSSIYVDLPMRWTQDIVTGSRLPITTTMICVNYSAGVAASPTCAGNNINYQVTASNVLTAQTSSTFSLGIRQVGSPPTLQPSDPITIISYSGSYQIDTCTVYVSNLLPNLFTSVAISAAPTQTMTVNTQFGFVLDIGLSDFANNNDDIQIILPSELSATFVSASGSGNYNLTTSTVTGQTMFIYHRRLDKTYAKGSVYSVTIYRMKAPPSTKTTNQITVKIVKNGFDKMIGYTTIRAVASTLTGSAAATLSTVNKVTTYRINITTVDPLTSSGMVKITFPSTITPTLTSGCATLSGSVGGVRTNPTCAYDGTSNTITITTMNSSTSSIVAQTLRFVISGVQNAPSVNPSGSFIVATYYTTDVNDLVSQGTIAGVTATLDIINPSTVSVVPSSFVVSNTLTTYTLNFVTSNLIPQGGYAQMNIPNGIVLNVGSVSSYCKLSVNSSAFFTTTCAGSFTNPGYYVNFSTIAQSSSLPSGTTISLRIESLLTNPGDTSIVSSFTIKTYHSDSFGIEQLTTGISVQMDTPATMTSMLVSRTSQLNSNAAVTYTFKLKQPPAMPASRKLIIGFPSTLIISGAISCASLTPVTLNCSQSGSNIQIMISEAVSAGAQFGVSITNIGNPPSFAPFSTPFTFDTKSSDNMLKYATGSYTPPLQTSTPSAFVSCTGTYSSLIYGQATNLQVTVTPSARMVPSYMLVTIPSSFTVPSTLSCTSWSCASVSSNVIRINGITSTSQFSFTITGMNAPLAASSTSVIVSSYDSGGYKIDENTSPILFAVGCTMPCRTCSTNTSVCLSCYSNTAITSFVYYYSISSSCLSSCPSGTYTSTLQCLDCNTLCQTCTVASTNCTSCVANSTYPYLFVSSQTGTCRSQCPIYFYPDTSLNPVQCAQCIIPCSTCTSVSQCTSCTSGYYFYNNSCGTSCPSGLYIPNNSTNNCDPCSTQCSTCSGTVNNCIGCSGTAALYNGSCVSACPAPLVIYNGICSSCSNVCLTCFLTYDNCTTCNTSSTLPYLYGTTCIALCPQLYYASLADGKCKLCSTLNIGCNNCTSTSTCGTCNWDQGYVFLTSRCYLQTPTGYYNSSGYALPCDATADCATCLNLAYNCTACVTKNLQGNTCVDPCPAGFVGINKVCQPCTSNCRTCSNLQSNCTSCLPGLPTQVYLTNFQCLTTCPDYTYANVTNNECTSCFSPCEKCSSISQCTTCLNGFFFMNNSCVNPCPFGYLGINRICTRCTPNCDSCSLSLTTCSSCLPNFYLVSNTSTCVNPCPSGLYPNSALGTCTGCVSPCNTCSVTATNCTSCLNNLTLYNYSCGTSCPDGTYLLNAQCNPCNVNCSTCTSASVCVSCIFGLHLYSGNCISVCPSTHPVTTTGTCTACTDTNCIICNSLDLCSQCNYPTLLLSGHCLSSCPTDYASNGTHCNYSPTPNTTNTTTDANTTLNETLSSANLFPVPFTIAATFIGIACIMSKFQHSYTFISGSLYSMWSLLEWGSLGVGAYLYYQTNKDTLSISTSYIQALVFAGAVAFMYLLNILALFVQNCYLRSEPAFRRWLDKQGTNSCFYIFATIIGVSITHKFKNILFCKLFGFDIFKARLQNVQSFRIFNILAFLSFIPSAAILFSTSYMIYKHHVGDQELMAYVDILVLTVACIVLAIFNSRKGDDFFEEKDEDGYVINKRIVQSDSIMQEAIVPFMAEDHEDRGNMAKNNTHETQRKFKSYMSSLSDEPSYQYIEPKDVQNISIQAAPVLQDYSKIDFYNDEELSEMSMFKKADKSVNMTHRLNANEVSIQNDMNIFDHKEVSIQNNPMQDDISVQHQVDVRDISLQNVANLDDQGVQMSRHDEDHSIQVGVLVNNASIQYSAKPVFENISQDYIDSEEEPDATHNKEEFTQDQQPADDPQQLKAQLELDVDEKLRKRQQEMELEKEEEIARRKEDMIKKFHEQQDKKILSREKQLQRNDQAQKMNRMYNNENSRMDGSSLMDSNANIMVHFRKDTKKQIRQPQSDQRQKKQRVQSAKTEKELIDMIQNNQPGLDVESSMSFNVTRDLEDGGSNKNGRVRNVVYEEQDKNVDSAGDDIQLQEPQTNKRKEVYILENDAGEEVPSIEKSRSTNFLSTNGRRPPLPARMNSKNLLDESSNIDNSIPGNEDQEIVHHPIKAIAKHGLPHNYREEDLEYNAKTNLVQFLDKRKNNPVSAQQFGSNRNLPHSQSDQLFPKEKQTRQNPLPLPKIQRLKSQQSNHSNDNSERLYKMSTRKALLEDRKLQFEEEEIISDFNTEQDDFGPNGRLPKVYNSEAKLRNVKSHSKIPERDTSYEKPVHRQILGKQRFVDRTEKFLEKQYKKAQSTKKKIQQMEVMLERPNVNVNRGYLKETHSSQDKKKKSDLEKVYMNNPFQKKM